ncbi:MAG: M23 family metallopeptidase, partial [Pseudomonadota bacterium]
MFSAYSKIVAETPDLFQYHNGHRSFAHIGDRMFNIEQIVRPSQIERYKHDQQDFLNHKLVQKHKSNGSKRFVFDVDDMQSRIDAQSGQSDKTVKKIEVKIRLGQSLASVLSAQNIKPAQINRFARSLDHDYRLRKIQPGDHIELLLKQPEAGDDMILHTLTFIPERASGRMKKSFYLIQQADGQIKKMIKKTPYRREMQLIDGRIDTSLFASLAKHNILFSAQTQFVNLFAFEIDFQRDIRKGDRFAIYLKHYKDAKNNQSKHHEILYAMLEIKGHLHIYYPFRLSDGTTGFFNATGQSAQRALLKTPISAGRLSSAFGMRRHPILGYNKMHKGIDFAAPIGTPIFAAGDGVVEKIGWNGGYGRYIRIRHNATYKTAYAHLSRFSKQLKRGKRVLQGQVIGYVGTSGRSTGPHLHYEVIKHKTQINPAKLNLPHTKNLNEQEMIAFRQQFKAI